MSEKGRGTRDEAEDRAAEAYTLTLKLLGCRPSEIISKRMAFRKGFWRGYEAAEAAERERIIAELEDIQQGGDEWRRYDEALRKALEHYADKDNWCESQHEDNVELDITWYIGADNEGRKYGWTVAAEALEATGGEK